MGGAYTAKEATAADPGNPPGWNPLWPWPGVTPPGYEYDLSLDLSTPATVVWNGSTSGVTLGLFDQTTYATGEPSNTMTWSATFDDTGDAVLLNETGSGSPAMTVVKSYLEISPQWGLTPSFEFSTVLADVGRAVSLFVTSTPFDDDAVSAVGSIVIAAPPPPEPEDPEPPFRIEIDGTVTVTGTPDYSYYSYNGHFYLTRGSSAKAWTENVWDGGTGGGGDGWGSSVILELPESSSSASEGTFAIDVAVALETFYGLKYRISTTASNPFNIPPVPDDAVPTTLAGTIKVWDAENNLVASESFSFFDDVLDIPGLLVSFGNINGITGAITIY